MKTCLVLRHVAFEDLGTLAAVLQRHGFETRYLDVGVDTLARARVEDSDLLVVLGGPIGVYDEADYPFLVREMALISERLRVFRPTLGICLGAQLMAKALGSGVGPGPAKEIGWAPVNLTPSGRESPLRHLEGFRVLHWHGDNFDLPPACESLAYSTHCPFQAFWKKPSLLGIQFHVEVDPRRIEAWLIGHTAELRNANIDPNLIREGAGRYGEPLREISGKIFDEWLDNLEF